MIAGEQLPGLLAVIGGDSQVSAAVQLKAETGAEGQIVLYD